MSFKEKIQQEIINVLDAPADVLLERPKQKEHGDLSTNIAMKLAKEMKRNPFEIATDLKEKIKSVLIEKIEVVRPGFINFVVSNSALAESLAEVNSSKDNYGHAKKTKGKVLVEFVSANPTGDLHIGHGRQAAIGDTVSRVLDAAGYEVNKEFYINDYGVQMKNIAKTAWAAYECIKAGKMEAQIKEELKEQDYSGAVIPLVLVFHSKVLGGEITGLSEEVLGEFIKNEILNGQKALLKKLNVEFDDWFSETTLHADKKVDEVISKLKDSGQIYEEEGAIWFKAKDQGDVRDRVMKKSDGNTTYITADVAYHLNKLSRGYDKLINVWGADHHGQEVGLRGAITAAGGDGEKLEILFVQLVSLKKDDEEVKMSKRTGTVVTVQELLEEVGVDAFRYFLVESSPNNRMVFDVDLAKKQDKDNPVFYIQYAHARCCSIFRQLLESDLKLETAQLDFNDFNVFMNLFNVSDIEYQATKDLILKILDFPEEIQLAAENRSTSKIATYLKDLATVFHQFYTVCRVITDNKDLSIARLGLVETTRITIANGLKLLGISAPNKM